MHDAERRARFVAQVVGRVQPLACLPDQVHRDGQRNRRLAPPTRFMT